MSSFAVATDQSHSTGSQMNPQRLRRPLRKRTKIGMMTTMMKESDSGKAEKILDGRTKGSDSQDVRACCRETRPSEIPDVFFF